jgi:integrase
VNDGQVTGLRLVPSRTKGHGKWILRYVSPVTNKRRDMGLGTYPETGIAAAREKALAARKCLGNGQDPIEERDAAKAAVAAQAAVMTFEQAARKVHADWKAGWRNPKHVDQWINTLQAYVFPSIGNRKVDDLTAADFAAVLKPIWLTKVETASRVKQRCHKVMKWCQAQELVPGNPVDVVDHLLPSQPGKSTRVQHQPSMPWQEVPSFVSEVLRTGQSNATRSLLEFVILTAARSGEARAMQWDEVDLEKKVWTVPATRMKAKVTHRVPLSARAVEILNEQRGLYPHSDLVFPSPRGKQLTDNALTKFLRDHNVSSSDAGRTATVHGFRSSFRDWASENGYPRDAAERALAHTIKNQAEAAYHRTDLLEQRRPMMEAWAQHVCGLDVQQNVVPIAGMR